MPDSDFGSFRNYTEWAVLVCPQKKGWLIYQVVSGTKIGEYEHDLTKKVEDWIVGSIFDSSTKTLLDALTLLGNKDVITELLSGVCRGFVEANANLDEWIKKPPE
jgi:hypothetical protein